MKKTQLEQIKKQLLEHGKVSRNECLRNYISRLGAIIHTLRQQGFDIEGDYVKTDYGKDYVYKLKSSPYKKVEYRVGGKLVATEWKK